MEKKGIFLLLTFFVALVLLLAFFSANPISNFWNKLTGKQIVSDLCEADFDCDGDVDEIDSTKFNEEFGRNLYNNPCTLENPCNGDFDCDGDVDGVDDSLFKEDYGRGQYYNICSDCVKDPCVYPDEINVKTYNKCSGDLCVTLECNDSVCNNECLFDSQCLVESPAVSIVKIPNTHLACVGNECVLVANSGNPEEDKDSCTSNGQCLSKGFYCQDSDNGKDYYEAGFVKWFNSEKGIEENASDGCWKKNPKILIEVFCEKEKLKSIGFSCLNGCGAGKCIKLEPPEQSSLVLPYNVQDKKGLCKGCVLKDVCYSIGYRKDFRYCSEEFGFLNQLEQEEQCQQDFQCISNSCLGGFCEGEGAMKRISNFFGNMLNRPTPITLKTSEI